MATRPEPNLPLFPPNYAFWQYSNILTIMPEIMPIFPNKEVNHIIQKTLLGYFEAIKQLPNITITIGGTATEYDHQTQLYSCNCLAYILLTT